MGVKQDFKEKKIYDETFPKDFFNQNFIDLDKENRYGIVDYDGNLILPKPAKIAPADEKGRQQSLSFVANAYNAMIADLQNQIANGRWDRGSLFSDIQLLSSYEDAYDNFDKFMNSQFEKMSPKLYKNKNISNFTSFLYFYDKFMSETGYDSGFTLAGFCEKNNSLKQSGLVLELLSGEKNNYGAKYRFLSDPGLKRYLLLTEKYGFYVNRNSPWTLVANINSEAMQKFANGDSEMNMPTDKIFNNYYDRIANISYDFFVGYLVGFYNSVALSEPTLTYATYVTTPCNQYKTDKINRAEITQDSVEAVKAENKSLLEYLYFKTRFYETFKNTAKFKEARRQYNYQRKNSQLAFGLTIESIVGKSKNSKKQFYSLTSP